MLPPPRPEQKAGPDCSGEELHARIQRGDPDWQRLAFTQYHGLVQRLLLKALGPSAETDELLDDVFLSFFESAQRIRDSAKVKSYLVSITMNQVRREIRRRRRQAFLFKLMGNTEDMNQRPGTDDPKARAALVQLHRVLEELNADDRSAFLLRNLESMPFPEIAEVLNVSE
jgi:RNA polymerase sigma-70 factor, ECF subfamily